MYDNGNYSTLDSHTNTVISHAFAYYTRQDGVENCHKSYTLSKNHIRNTMLTRAKMIPYFIRTENLKRAAHTYLALI